MPRRQVPGPTPIRSLIVQKVSVLASISIPVKPRLTTGISVPQGIVAKGISVLQSKHLKRFEGSPRPDEASAEPNLLDEMGRLDGKVAIVTGGGAGFGRAVGYRTNCPLETSITTYTDQRWSVDRLC